MGIELWEKDKVEDWVEGILMMEGVEKGKIKMRDKARRSEDGVLMG